MKTWHRFFLGLLALAVILSLIFGLLILTPPPVAVADSYLPLHGVFVILAFNPLLAQ